MDNSPVNLVLMRSILEPHGSRVVTGASAGEGLELARQTRPDLIISDVHMPGQDGFDFIRQVKANPALARIPFAFLSSTIWKDTDPMVGLSLGATEFIMRPIEPVELLRKIETWLSG